MKKLLSSFSLVQKVAITVFVLLVVTSIVTGVLISTFIRQSYLSEQKQSLAQFVQKQAHESLTSSDFLTDDFGSVQTKFDFYRNEIAMPDVVRIKIYNREGVVISSDQPELIGQKSFIDESDELDEILEGKIVGTISVPDKAENKYEQNLGQLLELYVPITFDDVNVDGIVEIYLQFETRNLEIIRSQRYAVVSIAGTIAAAFIILLIIVRSASKTLIQQDIQLKKDIQKEQEYSLLKDEFITMSSHQLRTPASAIKWSLELLEEEFDGKNVLNDEQKEALSAATANTETLIAIINNLLIIAEIKPDYFKFENKAYLIKDIVYEIIKKYQPLINEKNIKIVFMPGQETITTTIKKEALGFILESMIKNAIDYSSLLGEIKIEIIVSLGKVQILVSDGGIGIPDDERVKVFGKFFRASNSIEKINVGSGMSLYIAQKIATGYGGLIRYEALPKGSKFVLEIFNGDMDNIVILKQNVKN